MKCVGAEDGQQACQRCKRSNTESVLLLAFLLHRSSVQSLDVFSKNTGVVENQVQSQSRLRLFLLYISLTRSPILPPVGSQKLPRCSGALKRV